MKIIMTCGTFDMFHIGHLNILKRAKELGDYLIVGVSSDKCNSEKNKQSFINQNDRINIVRSCKYVDEVFLEESLDLKQKYIEEYNVDIFVIGDDWKNKFDYLNCKVIYLERTPNISSTLIKKNLNKTDIFFFKLYSLFHDFIDKYLTEKLNKIIFRIEPNIISFISLSMFFPIYMFDNFFLKGCFIIIHDLLDRTDGVMARIYQKDNIKRDVEFGDYLDSILDKLFLCLVGIFIIDNNYLYIKIGIHLISFYKRTYNYLNTENNLTKNKSTISGKMGTFFENISLLTYFWYPYYFNFFVIFSISLQIQSLYEKF